MTIIDSIAISKELVRLCSNGMSLDSAVCELHRQGTGLLGLVDAVANVANLDRKEAMKLVVSNVNRIGPRSAEGS